ncbi:pickpocket protein 28-like [Anopheles cruzii]|uniref:pickpocket protein 28-like n=1 Tax=Anopheles cruzii TaxID=68878 RepID=UPI0022EC48F7|nr:pickpocket protein 28-like [Anopheles cruzii]
MVKSDLPKLLAADTTPGDPTEAPDVREQSLWIDYCLNSTIHGFRYFVPGRSWIERMWWMIVCLVSLYGCGRLIHSVYTKWDRDPVVVTFAEKTVPVYSIPFPAVLICPEIKVRKEVFDFSKVANLYDEPGVTRFMAKEQIAKLEAMLQVCDFSIGQLFDNYHWYDDGVVDWIQRMAIPFEDIFISCGWRTHRMDCSEMFKKTLTEAGICYTFNSLAAEDLMRKDQLHPDYVYSEENTSSPFWSMDEGYAMDADTESYPRRTFGAGMRAGLYVVLKARLADADYICGNSFQGFKVHLYPPHQYPRVNNQFFRIPLGQEVSVSVDPQIIDTSPKIKAYKMDRRKCSYNRERKLRFFKLYTKNNCDTECLANYTLQMCGCVPFSLPRTPGARICGMGKLMCCDRAQADLQGMDLLHAMDRSDESLERCDCLTSCNTIYYDTEISQAKFDWRMLAKRMKLSSDEIDQSELSYLKVHFKVSRFIPIKRSELFGVTDFLANCGGILGLFMGVSILSIVEILYYCTLKPFMDRRAAVASRQPPKVIKSTLILPPDEYKIAPIRHRAKDAVVSHW